jgi:hypothetical protein
MKDRSLNICGFDLHKYEGRSDFKPGVYSATRIPVQVGPVNFDCFCQIFNARARKDPSFRQALEQLPESAQLKSDLASAHFQCTEATGQSIDYGSAAEWYGRALAEKPDDQVALFNRAIRYERLFLYVRKACRGSASSFSARYRGRFRRDAR